MGELMKVLDQPAAAYAPPGGPAHTVQLLWTHAAAQPAKMAGPPFLRLPDVTADVDLHGPAQRVTPLWIHAKGQPVTMMGHRTLLMARARADAQSTELDLNAPFRRTLVPVLRATMEA